MSIDKFHFLAKGEKSGDIVHTLQNYESSFERPVEAGHTDGAHTIYEMRAGVEHLYVFEDGAQAAETFERWRRQPCENIALTLGSVPQVGKRLPVGSEPHSGCDIDISWDGEFDTDGDPNGSARWKVRCGQPVAGEAYGQTVCRRHLLPTNGAAGMNEAKESAFLQAIKRVDAEVNGRFEEHGQAERGMHATQEEVEALRSLAATLAMVFGPFPTIRFQ